MSKKIADDDFVDKTVSVRLTADEVRILTKKLGGVSEGIRYLIKMYADGQINLDSASINKYTKRENELLQVQKTINDLESSPSLKVAYKSKIEKLKDDLEIAKKQLKIDAETDLTHLASLLNFKKQA